MIKPCGKYYVTTEDMEYQGIKIPKGTPTDGISYKFRFIGVFINKFDPLYIEAVIFHDYLTRDGIVIDWDKANRVFEDKLPNTKIARIMVFAVKQYKMVKEILKKY